MVFPAVCLSPGANKLYLVRVACGESWEMSCGTSIKLWLISPVVLAVRFFFCLRSVVLRY